MPGGEIVRDILEWYEQKRINTVVGSNGGYGPDGTIPAGGPVVNKNRPMKPERMTELFGNDPPPGSGSGEPVVKKFERVTVLVPGDDPTTGDD